MLHCHARRPQRGVRLGERRRDQRRERRAQVGQQRESLGGSGQQRDLVDGTAMPLRDGATGSALVVGPRVSAEVGQPGGEPIRQPAGWLSVAHVDGEVEHAGFSGLIAVVARRSERN